MAQPYSLSFGPWLPDGGDVAITMPAQYSPSAIPLADCLNVYWSDQGYRSIPGFAGFSPGTLAALPLGARALLDATGSARLYAGTATDLYQLNGSNAWASVSKSAGAYTGSTSWSFADFDGCIIAANGSNLLQAVTVNAGNFADVTGSPIGSVLGVINQSLFVGNLTGGFQSRVQWSGIGDHTSWPTPLTDAAIAAQSSYEDLTEEFGSVYFIAGGPLQGVIFQQLGLTLANYVGGDVVFQFSPFERKRGLLARNAAVQVGSMTHFLSQDGFYMTDGSQVIPTGASTDGNTGLDRWFFSNVNTAALQTISAAYDPMLKCVLFAIPTGSNTTPDTLLLLNPKDERWTRAQIPTELLFTGLTTGSGIAEHFAALFAPTTHQLGKLSGTPLSGYVETYDGAFLDGYVRDVVEAQPQIQCTDTPTMQIGTRDSLQDAITYSAANTPDGFSRRVTWDPPPAGRYIRTRVTSAAASALNGATIYTEMGGV